MRISTLAALLGLALLAAMVAPAVGAPSAEANSKCPKGDGGEEGGEEGGKGGGKGGGGGGPLIDIALLLSIDLSGLGELLNSLLGLIIGMGQKEKEGPMDKCEIMEMTGQMEELIADLYLYLNLLGIKIQVNLLLLLGPLLEAVQKLLESLLGGNGSGGLLSGIINLVLGLLDTLGLKLDLLVAAQLGNLLNLNVLALLNLGS
uniref:Uncharacterized protein n=1 Tax=Cuerna arida TaxID=1464854 RepID=A0A1B6GP77_9HEMI